MHICALRKHESHTANGRPVRRMRALSIVLFMLFSLLHGAAGRATDEIENLRLKFAVLKPYIENNQFQRPLHLNSVELDYSIRGDIYAVIDYPYADISRLLNDTEKGPANLCHIMMLHPNTKYCRVVNGKNGKVLSVKIGNKYEQPLDEAYDMDFNYRNDSIPGTGYLRMELKSDAGPFSTKDYLIMLRVVGLDGNRSFMHLSYSLGYGFVARTAMKVYLATIGRDKVGFTRLDNPPGAEPCYIRGLRGVVERNTMRYYLAIEAFLNSTYVPPDKQLNRRLARWFDATEKYARQLHEMNRQEYLHMKHEEFQRFQSMKGQVVLQDDPKR
ncbi:MAG: hypothetical protein M0P30_01780 [Syntrophorhabdaceae bacterium]|nr:hypothetical protein [Syntrophorhabdaceae bacterium]